MFGQQEQRGVRRAHSPDSHEGDSIRHLPQQHRPNQFHHGGGQHFGHNQHHFHHNQNHHKRFRGDNSFNQPLSLEDKIARLGETGFHNADIGGLVKEIDVDLMNRSQDETRINTLVSKICRCIVSFPTRVGTYSTLIGLISVKHYNISCQIINALHGSYPLYLEAQKWSEALTIIHILSSLVNCKVIRPSALLSQFEFLLESTIEDTAPQARSDYFVYTVLSSLPYVAQELDQEETREAFEKLLSTIETYLSKRSKNHLNFIRVWQSTDSTIQMDYLDSLWVQMRNFRANGWNETFLHRPYNDKEYKDTMAASLIPTNSPTFQIPGHTEQCFYPSPKIVFRLFEDDITEGQRAIPGSDKIERFCIENHVRNIIDELAGEPLDCARHLAHMYRSSYLPMKYILIETILGELFTLPKPKHDEILYHTLLYSFSRIFPSSMSTEEAKHNYEVILNQAVKILYDNLETINVTCITRFVNWFSYHLNSTAFIYPWSTWADATSSDPTSPKVTFVQDILQRCIRFSFRQKIQCLVKEDLPNLMPAEVSIQSRPVFGDHPRAQEFTDTIKNLIVTKADGKTICETLNIVVDGVELPEDFVLREEKHSEKLLKIDIFTTVILALSSRSVAHLSNAIGKFRNVFKALMKVPNGQIQMLQTVNSCLELHPQLQVILIDKLLKADLVQASEVCAWIFSDSMKPNYLKSSVWELLNNTIARLIQVVDKLTDEKNDLIYDTKEAEDKATANKLKTKETEEGRTTPTPGDDDNGKDDDVVMKKELVEVDDSNKIETVDEELKRREEAQKANEIIDEKMKNARIALKEFVLHVFTMFREKLNEHILECEKTKTSFMDSYYKWMIGRMQEVYYGNIELTREIYNEIRVIVDGVPSIGSSIINLNQ